MNLLYNKRWKDIRISHGTYMSVITFALKKVLDYLGAFAISFTPVGFRYTLHTQLLKWNTPLYSLWLPTSSSIKV